jgi:Dolichyl-phosphate-mannose-protein mannosyltransferase
MNLLTQSFWRDEAFTGLLIRHNPIDIIKLTAQDSTPPLYYLILWVWTQVWGDSEIALRSLSTVFWLVSSLMMWKLAQELKLAKPWIALALMITQPFVVVYAFEARAYEELLLLTATSLYLFLIKCKLERAGNNSLVINLLLILSLTAALYTHLFGMFVVLILLGWAVIERNKWQWLVIPLIFFAPWVPVIINFSQNGGGLPYTLDWQRLSTTLLVVGIPLLLPVFMYLPKLSKSKQFSGLAILWAFPIVGAAVYSKVRQQFLFQPRYLIETAVPLVAMISMASRQIFGRWLVMGVLLTQLFLSIFVFYQQKLPQNGIGAIFNPIISNTYKSPYRDLARYVKENQLKGDVIVNSTPLTYLEAHYYGLPSVIYNPNREHIPTYLGSVLINETDDVSTLPIASHYFVISSREAGGESQYNFPGNLVWTRDYGTLQLSLYDKI